MSYFKAEILFYPLLCPQKPANPQHSAATQQALSEWVNEWAHFSSLISLPLMQPRSSMKAKPKARTKAWYLMGRPEWWKSGNMEKWDKEKWGTESSSALHRPPLLHSELQGDPAHLSAGTFLQHTGLLQKADKKKSTLEQSCKRGKEESMIFPPTTPTIKVSFLGAGSPTYLGSVIWSFDASARSLALCPMMWHYNLSRGEGVTQDGYILEAQGFWPDSHLHGMLGQDAGRGRSCSTLWEAISSFRRKWYEWKVYKVYMYYIHLLFLLWIH